MQDQNQNQNLFDELNRAPTSSPEMNKEELLAEEPALMTSETTMPENLDLKIHDATAKT